MILLTSGVYATVGIRRWTALLAYPALILQVPLMVYALGRQTSVWEDDATAGTVNSMLRS